MGRGLVLHLRFLNAVSWNWRFTKGGQVGLFGYPKTLIRLKLNKLTPNKKWEPLVHVQTPKVCTEREETEIMTVQNLDVSIKRFSSARDNLKNPQSPLIKNTN
jgi:hypothetical protein